MARTRNSPPSATAAVCPQANDVASGGPSGLAVAAFVLSIVGCAVAVAALVVGIVALVRTKKLRDAASSAAPAARESSPERGGRRRRPTTGGGGAVVSPIRIYECGGKRYQLLTSVWDHETGDFKVLYKCLYEVEAKPGKYERHTYAVSHYERWKEKFTYVGSDDDDGSGMAEQGWPGDRTVPCEGKRAGVTKGPIGSANEAGIGTRRWVGDGAPGLMA